MSITIKTPTDHEAILSTIAQKKLGFMTLETRQSDSLDFLEVAVWAVKDALEAAYQAGRLSMENNAGV